MIAYKRGHISIAFVCMVLGFMLAIQFRTTMDQKASVPHQRAEELAARLLETEKAREALQERIAEMEAESKRLAESENPLAQRVDRELRMRAGLEPVSGTGVVVTIDDSKITPIAGDNQNLYIIHDDDLLRVINELRAAGAEALSINGQRLIATSEIRCAGPTLSVNNVRSAPPYEIRAIGEKDTLERALKMRGGVAETLKVWGIQLDIRRSDDVVVPAYKGSVQYNYARYAGGQEAAQ